MNYFKCTEQWADTDTLAMARVQRDLRVWGQDNQRNMCTYPYYIIIVAKIFARFSFCLCNRDHAVRHSICRRLNAKSFFFCHRQLGLGRERNTHEGVTHFRSNSAPSTLDIFVFNSAILSSLTVPICGSSLNRKATSAFFVFRIKKVKSQNVFKICN